MPFISNSPEDIPALLDYQKNDYLSVAVTTMVVYDYILRLNQEVDLIWKRKLSCMTWCYTFLRYIGLFYAVASGILGLSFPTSDETCSALFILTDGVLQSTLMLVIQGVMTVRVCALYENTRKITVFLAGAFVMLQLFAAGLNVVGMISPYGETSREGILLGVPECLDFPGPSPILWMSPVNNAVSLAYDLMLIVMIIYRSVWQLKEHREQRSRGIKGLMRLIIRHGLLYFFWILAFGIINTMATSTPNLTVVEVVVFEDMAPALLTIFVSMMGPWLILAIREPYAGQCDESHDATTVRWADSSVAFTRPATDPGNPDAMAYETNVDEN